MQTFINNALLERLFEILSQFIIDCCTQVVSSLNVETPNTYSKCFVALGKNNIISESFAETLSYLVKMRNLVVHQYGKINHGLLIAALGQITSDFEDYRSNIISWIKTSVDL